MIPNAGSAESYDRYAYVQNNPIKFIDPSGHLECDSDACWTPAGSRVIPKVVNEIVTYGQTFANTVEYAFANFILSGGDVSTLSDVSLDPSTPLIFYEWAFEHAASGLGYEFDNDTIIKLYPLALAAAITGANELGKKASDSILKPGTLENVPGIDPNKVYIPEYKVSDLDKRGWAIDDIIDVVTNPALTRSNPDIFNRRTGNPVTYYYREDGYYVVIEDGTGMVVQMSDRSDAGWIDEMTDSPITPIK